jgi:hypothetical protein
MSALFRMIAFAAIGIGLSGCVVYPADYYGPPARYGYYAPPPPPPPHGWYGPRPWR